MAAKDGPLSADEARVYLDLLQTLPALHRGPHRMFQNPVLDTKPLRICSWC